MASKKSSDGPFPSGKGMMSSAPGNRHFIVPADRTASYGTEDGVVNPTSVSLKAGAKFGVWAYGQTTWGVSGLAVPLVVISFADLEQWIIDGVIVETDRVGNPLKAIAPVAVAA